MKNVVMEGLQIESNQVYGGSIGGVGATELGHHRKLLGVGQRQRHGVCRRCGGRSRAVHYRDGSSSATVKGERSMLAAWQVR